jgi:hypothetical protein
MSAKTLDGASEPLWAYEDGTRTIWLCPREAPRHVITGGLVVVHAGEHDVTERRVGLTVPAPVQPVPDDLARAGGDPREQPRRTATEVDRACWRSRDTSTERSPGQSRIPGSASEFIGTPHPPQDQCTQGAHGLGMSCRVPDRTQPVDGTIPEGMARILGSREPQWTGKTEREPAARVS